jgi:hypothetical protein
MTFLELLNDGEALSNLRKHRPHEALVSDAELGAIIPSDMQRLADAFSQMQEAPSPECRARIARVHKDAAQDDFRRAVAFGLPSAAFESSYCRLDVMKRWQDECIADLIEVIEVAA